MEFRSRVALQVVRLAKLGLNRVRINKGSERHDSFHGRSSNSE